MSNPCIILIQYAGRGDGEVLAVCPDIKTARATAKQIMADRPYCSFWMLDLVSKCYRDSSGKKKTNQNMLAQRLLYAFEHDHWTSGAELIGMDRPDITPRWTLSIADVKAQLEDGGNDMFCAIDREEHARTVRIAAMFGKPIRADILAECAA